MLNAETITPAVSRNSALQDWYEPNRKASQLAAPAMCPSKMQIDNVIPNFSGSKAISDAKIPIHIKPLTTKAIGCIDKYFANDGDNSLTSW
jgi:hypothetical protein